MPEHREQLFARCGKSEYVQSASSHNPEILQVSHPNVEVMPLPHNTLLVLQYIDKGIVKTFCLVILKIFTGM
jgi:hypothetical protein